MLHSVETYTIEQFTTHMQIECENRMRDELIMGSKVNHVTTIPSSGNASSGNTHNNLKVKKKNFKVNGNNSIKKNRPCFHCGKKGHYIKECRYRNNKFGSSSSSGKNKANVVEAENKELVAMVTAMQIGMITELHMASVVVTNDWWLDSGATIHVCNNKALFKLYNVLEEHEEVLMGNHVAAKVMGKGSVEISFTSGKKLTLVNVFHVPDLRKNLISANLLCKSGFKIVLEADKVIVSKNGVFVGKGYSCDGMFKLSINEISPIVYVVDSSLLWHARLGHLNYGYLHYMSKHNYITCKNDHVGKCEICVQAKMTKKPFHKVERSTELLELVHSDICELNGKLTRGGKRYFITFIDDHSRYTYVYLIRTKDEAFNKFKEFKTIVENQKDKKIKML